MVKLLRRGTDESEALRASRARLLADFHAFRRCTERDLDSMQQQLSVVSMKLRLVEERLGRGSSGEHELAAEARAELLKAMDWLREVGHGLYPAVLSHGDLETAIRDAVARAGVEASVECRNLGRYSPELEAVAYFCCEEAIRNVAAHAGSNARAGITVVDTGSELRFTIHDDGPGFDPTATASPGLRHVSDCAQALGGELVVDSNEHEGTTVTSRLPL